jgi:hypothetical protein
MPQMPRYFPIYLCPMASRHSLSDRMGVVGGEVRRKEIYPGVSVENTAIRTRGLIEITFQSSPSSLRC